MDRRHKWICAGLLALCAAIYGQTLTHDFITWDDPLYVTDNHEVQAGLTWANVGWAFTTERAMYVHPITWMSHMLDCDLYGLKPWGHHLTNLLFHALNSVLLFLALSRMTRRVWPSALVAALFAVHPLHVESVAWIAERKDVLSMFFWAIGLWTYAQYRQTTSLGNYLVVTAAFLFGFMSKPMAVTFPFVLLLLDYWPFAEIDRTAPFKEMSRKAAQLAAEKIPLFLLAAGMCALTLIMQMRGNNITSTAELPLANRCANAVVVYVIYLVKTICPSGLALFYPHPFTRPLWQVAGAALVLVLITVLSTSQMRKRPYLIVGWLWYLGTLVPVIELVQAGSFSHADRYTYIPSIGIFIMVVWAFCELVESGTLSKKLAVIIAAASIAAFSAAATRQTAFWSDSETLLLRTLDVTANNTVAHDGLGAVYRDQKRYDEALKQYERSLQINPRNAIAVYRTALVFQDQGRNEEAIAKFNEALALKPDFTDAQKDLKLLLRKLGRFDAILAEYGDLQKKAPKSLDDYCRMGAIALKTGDVDAMANAFEKAAGLDPGGKRVNLSIADALAEDKRYPEAMSYYANALQNTGADAKVLCRMGAILETFNRKGEAEVKYREALSRDERFVPAHNSLGTLLANSGRLDESAQHFREALSLDQHDVQSRANLAKILAYQGQVVEAVALLEEAVRLAPESVDLRLGLAQMLIGGHRNADAEAVLAKVLEMAPDSAAALKMMQEIRTATVTSPQP